MNPSRAWSRQPASRAHFGSGQARGGVVARIRELRVNFHALEDCRGVEGSAVSRSPQDDWPESYRTPASIHVA
jgi:hypothetical protein